ncbi:hypothetical protein H4R33_003690 [Dimargaris cristalligena]|uniref:Uncharacterized protein n=1 Tax=Dimargaris cristalligena TaxID=215637 RepID=A0A4Q0A1C9_9FUNG|nr:hypothetical protein H4R33_003690 [Dimargaris cristalligena]RKP39261.1 hypothetical protein BJ085DRAFT_36841 [Dimargaris cristalligena]|eukprot:RKP39261.1 hypothetical protein BJ085DRAFT_36841 [Dimargaris cristalligena]
MRTPSLTGYLLLTMGLVMLTSPSVIYSQPLPDTKATICSLEPKPSCPSSSTTSTASGSSSGAWALPNLSLTSSLQTQLEPVKKHLDDLRLKLSTTFHDYQQDRKLRRWAQPSRFDLAIYFLTRRFLKEGLCYDRRRWWEQLFSLRDEEFLEVNFYYQYTKGILPARKLDSWATRLVHWLRGKLDRNNAKKGKVVARCMPDLTQSVRF